MNTSSMLPNETQFHLNNHIYVIYVWSDLFTCMCTCVHVCRCVHVWCVHVDVYGVCEYVYSLVNVYICEVYMYM